MSLSSESNLFKKLPETVQQSLGLQNDDQADQFLEKRLPKREAKQVKDELHKRFPIAKERQVHVKRLKKQGCPRQQQLSNTKKRALGLYNINRRGLLFKDLLPLNDLWKQYIENCLQIQNSGLNGYNHDPVAIAQNLLKADFHGAYMEVQKSCCPNLVGIGGIVISETKNVIKLLGKDNITRSIPKKTCEFKIQIKNFIATFLGKNLLVRAVDRSVKKFRNIKYVEL